MSKDKKEKSDNYLDFIPVRSDKHKWEADEDGNVTIFVENKGLFNKLAQLLLKKPKVSQIHLEEFGSFIFPLIDGNDSIYEIGQKVTQHFAEKADPLYPRLIQYFKMLNDYGFIEYKV
ncbi:MAG: PqqD family protein [Eubacterium sp.]|nr:PqqD family protein [Eubacterium sp.]